MRVMELKLSILIDQDIYDLLNDQKKILESRSGIRHTLSEVIRELLEVLDTSERGAVISGQTQIELERFKNRLSKDNQPTDYESIIQTLIDFWLESKGTSL